MTGIGLSTATATLFEAPPPGAGLLAVTALVELPAMSEAGSAAFISVPLTNVVVSAIPFQAIAVFETNPVPVISRVVAAAPAVRLAGLTAVIAGAGLFTLNATAAEVPPAGAGLTAMIDEAIPTAKSDAGRAALTSVPLT